MLLPVFRQSATFVPRRARFHTPEYVAAQGAPQRFMYGIEALTAQNYQLIDHMRSDINQYEQNAQDIEERLHEWNLWNQDNQQ